LLIRASWAGGRTRAAVELLCGVEPEMSRLLASSRAWPTLVGAPVLAESGDEENPRAGGGHARAGRAYTVGPPCICGSGCSGRGAESVPGGRPVRRACHRRTGRAWGRWRSVRIRPGVSSARTRREKKWWRASTGGKSFPTCCGGGALQWSCYCGLGQLRKVDVSAVPLHVESAVAVPRLDGVALVWVLPMREAAQPLYP
jgi:hypothetical protein